MQVFRIILALALLIFLASPSRASALETAPPNTHVVISELQTGTAISATQEFVELYNPVANDIDVTGWTIEYKSATSTDTTTNWTKKATLNGQISAHGFLLVAAHSYLLVSDAEWTPALASTAGNIRVKSASGSIIDQLGYGETANAAEISPAVAPKPGESLERLPGRLDELAGNGVDTDNNKADFIIRSDPQPQNHLASLESPADAVPPEIEDADDSSGADPVPPYIKPQILVSELLIDPESPLTDANDEFIELYNAGDTAVSLDGYALKTGASLKSYYVINAVSLEPNSYAAFYSRDTKLSLTNTGGAAQLVAPDGTIVDTTPMYGSAITGQSWALIDGSWQWTLQLTPGSANLLAALPLKATETVSPPKKAAKKTTTPKAAVKVKKASVKKPVKVKTQKTKAAKVVVTPVAATATKNLQPSTWLIIALAVLTIGYALYEFRYDLHNIYLRASGDNAARTEAGSESARRRND